MPKPGRRLRERAGVLVAFVVATVGVVSCATQVLPLVGKVPPLIQYGPGIAGLSGERRYLVLALNPAELRPAGGYTGTVGTVGLDNGRVVELTFGDVYRYDTKPGMPFVEPPEALQNHLLGEGSWRIADAAWSPDFPTAAADTLRAYELESGDTNIDGVITLTTYAVDRLLEAIGPVTVPEYNVTVSAGQTTLVALAMTRGVSTQTSNRKQFLDLLAAHTMSRVLRTSPFDAAKLINAFDEVRDRRDVMVWLKDPAAEAWLAGSPMGGTVGQQPGDYLYVVESNLEPPSKYNLVVQRADQLDIALDGTGTASDTLTMNWQNFAGDDGLLFDLIRSYSTNRLGLYGAYVRVLTPATSQLSSVSGAATDPIDAVEETSTAAGRNVFGNYLLMSPGRSTLTYGWTVPGAASQDQGLWTYRLTIQRQPGAGDNQQIIRVSLPADALVLSAPGMVVSGTKVALNTTLTADQTLEIRYSLP
jgi:hypothetical protein